MASLTHKLLKLEAKVKAGKKAIVKVADVPCEFRSIMWGGTSPRVYLQLPDGSGAWRSAAEWRKLGADF